jgi:hypothetical protein
MSLKFEDFTEVAIEIVVFWFMTLCKQLTNNYVEPAFSIILIAFLGFEFQTQFIKP